MTNKWSLLTAILFGLYLLVLTQLIVFKPPVYFSTTHLWLTLSNGNYVPFNTILGYLGGEPSWRIATYNLLGNILLFVPMGMFLPSLFRTIRWKGVFVAALVLSLTLETTQLFFIGTPDIDDVILNTLGAMLGYGVFKGVVLLVKKIDLHIMDKKLILLYILAALFIGSPLLVHEWLHGDYSRYLWIINQSYFSHFGSATYQLLLYIGLILIGISLALIALGIHFSRGTNRTAGNSSNT